MTRTRLAAACLAAALAAFAVAACKTPVSPPPAAIAASR
jgi:hypothetical protein